MFVRTQVALHPMVLCRIFPENRVNAHALAFIDFCKEDMSSTLSSVLKLTVRVSINAL